MLGTGIKMGITSDRMQCHFICYIQPFAATNLYITNVPQVGKYRETNASGTPRTLKIVGKQSARLPSHYSKVSHKNVIPRSLCARILSSGALDYVGLMCIFQPSL